MSGVYTKKECECGRIVRQMFQGLCWRCYCKTKTKICSTPKHVISLGDALDKVYEINGNVNKKGHLHAYKSFPSILIGHKVKLVLVD